MRKNKQFSIRISEQDLETIRRKSAQAHMSQSDYVTACWRIWARYSSPIWILLCKFQAGTTHQYLRL